jgi:hypothetical protein
MNVPIRMLGIANMIFWIVLIAFIASAGYSIKDIKFNAGEPTLATNADGNLTLTFPLYIDNQGYYGLEAFNITTIIYGDQDEEVTKTSTFVPTIFKGQTTTILHNVTLSIKQLAQTNPQLLLNDSSLNARVAAGFDFAELMPVQLSTNFTFPWGAPFHNLVLGQPQYSIVSSSSARVTVPLSFDNHAAFDIAGEISASLDDGQGALLAKSQTHLSAPAGSRFSGELSFTLPDDAASQISSEGGHVEIFFSSPLFEYGPMVTNLE